MNVTTNGSANLSGVNGLSLNSGTGTLGLTSGSGIDLTSGTGPINLTGTGPINLTGGGNINVTTTGANSLGFTSGTGGMTLNSGTGVMNLNTGNGAFTVNSGAGNINLTGTGANSIGLTSGTGGMTLNSGNGAFNVNSGSGNFNLYTGDASGNSQINLNNSNDTLSLSNSDTIGANTNTAGMTVRGATGIIIDSAENSSTVRGYTSSTSAAFNGNAGYIAGLYNGTQYSGLNVQPTITTLGGGGFANPSLLTLGANRATLSGGGAPGSTLTLGTSGANFASNTGGYPISVTGISDGVNPFDAVNFRQLQAVSTGVASIAAMSNIPGLDTNKKFGIGIGYGNFQGNSALAVGINGRLAPSLTAKLSVGAGLSYGATSVGTGLSYAW
ncbi:MAG: beta strand repeat-containing protein [Cyanobacteriota bacterium]